MLIKVNNEFLEFNDIVEMEKQIKLFEEISTTDGDFSYSFDLQKTITNSRILGSPFPDNISKLVYQKIPAKLLTDNGAETFDGYIRIEKITDVYECSFFAGNNNWFGMLSDPLRSLNWSEYDIIQNQSNVQDSILNDSGVVFPLIDNGLLAFRGQRTLKVQDFVGAIYVKDVFRKIFNAHGIKVKGELINDVNYQSSITINSAKDIDTIKQRAAFVHTTHSDIDLSLNGVYQKVLWTDDFNYPYYDGSANNFDLPNSRYVADLPMSIKVRFTINDSITIGVAFTFTMAIYVNGVNVQQVSWNNTSSPWSVEKIVNVDTADVIELYVMTVSPATTTITLINSIVTFQPIYVFKIFGITTVPNWTQQQYVSAILRIFNVLTHYDSNNKVITFNLFEKIKDKPAIDLSEFISKTEPDYSEFISDYGKNSYLSFAELEADEEFMKKNFERVPYDKGLIEINNDFLPDAVDILESEFTQPITYINPVFDMSIPKTDLITVESAESTESTAVSSGTGGRARFAIEEDIFLLGDLVRIEDSSNAAYNGDFVVYNMAAGYVEFSLLYFSTTASSKLTRLTYTYNDSDNVYLLRHVPTYNILNFSEKPQFILENTEISTWSPSFSQVIDQGKQISKDFVYSMNFTGQVTLVDQYFRLFARVLNDPVKLFCEAHLSHALFKQIDFLSPIMIKTLETTNLYYLNRITGYKESYYPCLLELIKIS